MIRTLNGSPKKVDLEHDYIVLYTDGTRAGDLIIQSEITDNRAVITVDHYNRKRENKGLRPYYHWREKTSEDHEELLCIMQE